jgi:hypothetical protein
MVRPERRNERWGDYVERVFLAVACVFIFLGFHAIQSSREDVIRRSCVEQNARHDQTIRKLDEIVRGVSEPARRARAERNKDGTIALIEAAIPKRDCEKRAKQLVK